MLQSKKERIFVILSGVFITNAIVAEMTGGKLIDVGSAVMSIGILPWPVVFLTTDLINEYFGKQAVKRISILTSSLIAFCFFVIFIAMKIPASKVSSVTDEQFDAVFGQSMWIIVGSIIAFLVSQLIDATLFHFVKSKTGNKMIWLRSTGSTIISQLFDSFIVLGIAFWMTGILSTEDYIKSGFTGYFVKLAIAILLTPLIYVLHYLIDNYLKKEEYGT